MAAIRRFSGLLIVLFFGVVGILLLPPGADAQLSGAVAQARANMQRALNACQQAQAEGKPLTAHDVRQMVRQMDWPRGGVGYNCVVIEAGPVRWLVFASGSIRRGWLDRARIWVPERLPQNFTFCSCCLDEGIKPSHSTD